MEATRKRNISPGFEYDRLFPKSEGDTKTIRKNANVSHTVEFIPKVVHETLNQTKQIAELLKRETLYETCSSIWHFVYRHINYKKDQEGFEQIRSPARAWHDRKQGVDCDCYSVFISSILINLGIPHILRITKYHRDYFQHIYPIVPDGSNHITMDCVTDRFNYEVPFSEKKDYPMDLQYLNGFDGDGMDELGKIIKKNMAKKNPSPVKTLPKAAKKAVKKMNTKKTASSNPVSPKTPASSVPAVKNKKGILKKVVNAVNKVNPATVLLRNGILAAMKLNVKNVAARLRWSYLTPQQVTTKNIDASQFQKLVETRQKLEKIFYGAGGKPDNLKKAILGGKGNKDKAVNGLGELPAWSDSLSQYTALSQLLGREIFYSENIDGMEGFQGFGNPIAIGLGEPVTLTTVGAAMGVIAGIVAALKQIGDIFKTKQKDSADFDESKTDAPENTPAASVNTSVTPATSQNSIVPEVSVQNTDEASQQKIVTTVSNEITQAPENTPPGNSESSGGAVTENAETNNSFVVTDNTVPPDTKESFWDKNKKWLKPVVIGVGGLTLIAVGYKMISGGKNKNKSSPASGSLSGIPKRKKKKNHHRKQKYKKAIALI